MSGPVNPTVQRTIIRGGSCAAGEHVIDPARYEGFVCVKCGAPTVGMPQWGELPQLADSVLDARVCLSKAQAEDWKSNWTTYRSKIYKGRKLKLTVQRRRAKIAGLAVEFWAFSAVDMTAREEIKKERERLTLEHWEAHKEWKNKYYRNRDQWFDENVRSVKAIFTRKEEE